MYKVKMLPGLDEFRSSESGIKRVIEAYNKYLPEFGYEITNDENYDLLASHAGSYVGADVVFCHGLYWTGDYRAAAWEWHINRNVIDSVKQAKKVVVPSRWVQEVFQRDMRFSPTVVPHGIDADEWKHYHDSEGYVLWNKNRAADVCSPEAVGVLANKFPNVNFISTFKPTGTYNNIKEIGVVDHGHMKGIIQRAGVYLSTTKETFGIGVLEAMAAGVPVLGFAYGGNLDTVKHGANGYLARPGDWEDLEAGLRYCLKYRDELGKNGMEYVKQFTWQNACSLVADVFNEAMYDEPPTVGVVIPAYNKDASLERAVSSALNQTIKPDAIVIVDDGSTDDTSSIGKKLSANNELVHYHYQNNSGVAVARNVGAEYCDGMKYLCFLDADDFIKPEFLESCVRALENDRSLHLAYTRLEWIKPDGSTGISEWPSEWQYDKQLKRQNQVPTCNVMRKETFERLGGYKKRYCPTGAGSEDSELWDRFGAYGYKCAMVDERPLFLYSFTSGHTAQQGYSETDWLIYHPWAHDGKHPFASYASTGRRPSHPVKQYDQPHVSVIIPVGPGHEELLMDAIDTIDGQTYRMHEIIVVWDSKETFPHKIKKAYPHVKWLTMMPGGNGAGAARNLGASHARGDFLLFLDADDWLYPDAIDKMIATWNKTSNIVYTDYVGKAIINQEYANKLGDRLLKYDPKDGEAVISYRSMDFDCDRAIQEPKDINRPYVWNLITSLVPRAWHQEIGGFDESMESWEDWDYWLRMARAGKCFTRIDEPLVVYRFYTGNRREHGAKIGESLVKYLLQKYEDYDMAGCNCKGKKASPPPIKIVTNTVRRKDTEMIDDNFVLCKYMSPNKGQHTVIGLETGQRYGHRAGGEVFYVNAKDIERSPNLFMPVERKPPAPQSQPRPLPPAPVQIVAEDTAETDEQPEQISVADIGKIEPAPEPGEALLSLEMLPGVTPAIAEQLRELSIATAEDIKNVDAEWLASNVKGVGLKRAEAIIAYVYDQVETL